MRVRQAPQRPASAQPPEGRLIGYARVSTAEQSLQMQTDALTKAGVHRDHIHAETASGVATRRPALALALRDCRKGDTLVVWKLDRLGRSMLDLLNRIDALEKRGVGLRSLTDGIDTTTPAGRLMLHMLGALAQFERDLIRERSRAGLQAHIARGGRVGAPRALKPEQEVQGRQWRRAGISVREIARRLGVTPQTVYVRVIGREPKQKR